MTLFGSFEVGYSILELPVAVAWNEWTVTHMKFRLSKLKKKKKWLKHNSIYTHYNYADLNGL